MLLPDDIAVRSDVQLLADAGLISIPVSGWPLSAMALRSEMNEAPVPDNFRGHIRGAWHRLHRLLHESPRLATSLAIASDPVAVRRFGDVPRGSAVRGEYWNRRGRLELRMSLALHDDDEDRREARADGSYAGVHAGGWLLSFGQVPRWWGPGFESSLILSTNARPVPAIAADTIQPVRFQSPWLRWLGPMDWRVFAGKLEGGRHVSDAILLGARLSLRPGRDLEIGLSRTAQWGGEGRPRDLDSLLKLLIGRDNRGDAGITLADEPGNQLGGFDVRWLSPLGDAPYAVYLQLIGEDEAGGLPSRYLGLGGAEIWGGFAGGTLRMHFEAAETTVEFYKSRPRLNLAYEHFIYRDGYRYRGRSIGHAMDRDGVMLSAGGIWSRDRLSWHGAVRYVDVNRGSPGRHTVSPAGERWEVWLGGAVPLWSGMLDWGAGAQNINPDAAATRTDTHLYARWERQWGVDR
ncbi:MAG: capsule assembly Wzi family protein [Gammaproteobacteria bacterium]|nr:capsule assembly Wzi family protein [Gammaproteobacteria bacterium]